MPDTRWSGRKSQGADHWPTVIHQPPICPVLLPRHLTPPPDRAFWTTFMNQDTPVFFGTEKIAQKLGYPVIYVGIERVRRGHYVMRFEELVIDPANSGEGDISLAHTRRLEADIQRLPTFWLWSHRRWKHRRPLAGL